jgi:Cdc6-like AAA superfamily ATPase
MLNGTDEITEFKYREKEIEEIEDFVWGIESATKRGCRFLMVTGSPGLGKTLSVTHVLKRASCKVIALNANITKSLKEIQQLIYEKLTGKRSKKLLTTQQLIRELMVKKCTEPLIVYIE